MRSEARTRSNAGRGLLRRVRPALLASVLAAASAQVAHAQDAPVTIDGTWFVVVHYRDTGTANPGATRWEDKVWTFTRESVGGNERLAWSEYPIVVFQDTSGRFEVSGGNPRSRVLAAWWPNAAQQSELDAGPRVNQRGARHKQLRGSDARGWSSASRMKLRSATAVGYQEVFSVSGLDALPVFQREDRLGNSGGATAEGVTEYAVESVHRGGQELRGRYRRDGRRAGSFRMVRTQPVRGLVSSEQEGTANDRFQQRMLRRQLRQREPGAAGDAP